MLSLLANSYSHTRFLKITSVVVTEPPPETEPVGWIGDEIPPQETGFFQVDFNNQLVNTGTNSTQPTGYGALEYDNTITAEGSHSIKFTGALNSTQYFRFEGIIPTPNLPGLTLSMDLHPRSVGKLTGAMSHVFMMYGDGNSNCKMYLRQDKTNIQEFRLGAENIFFNLPPDTWSNLVIAANLRSVSIYVNGVKIFNNVSTLYNMTPLQTISSFIIGRHEQGGLSSFNGNIDDFKVFDFRMTDTQVDNLVNNGSDLKLRLTLQTDGTDKTGNYNGVVFGNCINNTRAKYGSWSLTSDGVVGSTKYVEMPAITFDSSKGMSMSFWFYNESGLSTGQTRMIEAKRQNNTISQFYIEQYKNDRTKFRFSDNTGCIFYASPLNSWHKFVVTITALDVVNIWIDNIKVVSNITVLQGMSDSFDAGWRIGANNSNVANLCSFAGSIQEFKIWNRVLTDTEAIDVV